MPSNPIAFMTDYMWTYSKAKFWKEGAQKVCDDEEDMKGKIIVVTGSNTGIGKLSALQLAKRGAMVIMAVRNLEKGKEAVDHIKKSVEENVTIDLMKLDLGDLKSIRAFVDEFQNKYQKLDILINNAGILDSTGVRKETSDGFEMHVGTNHLGPFLLTRLLLDSLRKGSPSRVICVATGNIALPQFVLEDMMSEKTIKTDNDGMGAYDYSKMLNAICMYKLGKELEQSGIKLFQLCPGLVTTQMTDGVFGNRKGCFNSVKNAAWKVIIITPHQSCETIVFLSVAKSVGGEGKGKGEIYRFKMLWNKGNGLLKEFDKDEKSNELYSISEKLVGLK